MVSHGARLPRPQPDVAVECSGYILEELRDEANFQQFKKDVEEANIFIGSLIFVQELADKVVSVVEPNRDRLDAVCVFPSMPAVMKLNKIGSFTMVRRNAMPHRLDPRAQKSRLPECPPAHTRASICALAPLVSPRIRRSPPRFSLRAGRHGSVEERYVRLHEEEQAHRHELPGRHAQARPHAAQGAQPEPKPPAALSPVATPPSSA